MGLDKPPRTASATPSDYPPKQKTQEDILSYKEAQQLAYNYVVENDLLAQVHERLQAAKDSYKEAKEILRQAAKLSKFNKEDSLPYTRNGQFIPNNPYEQEIARLKRAEVEIENLIAGRIPRPDTLSAESAVNAGIDLVIGTKPVQEPFPPKRDKSGKKLKLNRREKDALYRERLQQFFDSVKQEVTFNDPLLFVLDDDRQIRLQQNSRFNVFKIEGDGLQFVIEDTDEGSTDPRLVPTAQQLKDFAKEEREEAKKRRKAKVQKEPKVKKEPRVIDLDVPPPPFEPVPLAEEVYEPEEVAPTAIVHEEQPPYEEVSPVLESEERAHDYPPELADDIDAFFEDVLASDPLPLAEAQQLLDEEAANYLSGKSATTDRLHRSIIIYARSMYPAGSLSDMDVREIENEIFELYQWVQFLMYTQYTASKIKEPKPPKEPTRKEIERNIKRFETGKGRIPAWRSIVFLISALAALGTAAHKGVTDPDSVRRVIAYAETLPDQLASDTSAEQAPDTSSPTGTQDTLPEDPELERIMEEMAEPLSDLVASNEETTGVDDPETSAR